MNQRDQGETEHSKTSQGSMRTGAGPGQPDDDEGSITSGSPKNLLLVAIAVALLTSAGLVFFIAWQWEDLGSASGKWRVAYSILSFTATGVFYSGTLVGLGTIATARPNDVSRRPTAVASLLSKAGAAVIILGVAAAVCTIAANDWEGRRGGIRLPMAEGHFFLQSNRSVKPHRLVLTAASRPSIIRCCA